MTGTWILPIARHLLRRRTYERVAAAAVADLQVDVVHLRGIRKALAYGAVWYAIGGGLLLDVTRETRELRHEAALLTGICGMQACYYVCLLTLVMQPAQSHRGLVLVVACAFSVLSTLCGFWPGDPDDLHAEP
jgi:hypothetical protein